jgi:hypothetical protein
MPQVPIGLLKGECGFSTSESDAGFGGRRAAALYTVMRLAFDIAVKKDFVVVARKVEVTVPSGSKRSRSSSRIGLMVTRW